MERKVQRDGLQFLLENPPIPESSPLLAAFMVQWKKSLTVPEMPDGTAPNHCLFNTACLDVGS